MVENHKKKCKNESLYGLNDNKRIKDSSESCVRVDKTTLTSVWFIFKNSASWWNPNLSTLSPSGEGR